MQDSARHIGYCTRALQHCTLFGEGHLRIHMTNHDAPNESHDLSRAHIEVKRWSVRVVQVKQLRRNSQTMAALVRSLRRLAVTPYFRRAVPSLSYSSKPEPTGMRYHLQLLCLAFALTLWTHIISLHRGYHCYWLWASHWSGEEGARCKSRGIWRMKDQYFVYMACSCDFSVKFQDPFNMGVVQGEWGTKAKPTIVPSMYEERLVGCICE